MAHRNSASQGKTESLSREWITSESIADAEGHLTVLIVYHRTGARVVPLIPGEPVVVGREPPAQVQVDDMGLSREHTRFTLTDAGDVLVEDLGSLNGTWMGNERIERGRAASGADVLLGRVTVSIRKKPASECVMAGLLDHERFRVALEDEVVRARHFGRRLAILMVRAPPGPSAHVSRWCEHVRAEMSPVDRLGFYSSSSLVVLLPEIDGKRALECAQKIVANSSVQGVRLLVGVAVHPETSTGTEKLIELCASAAARATLEQPVQAAPLGPWRPADRAQRKSESAAPVATSPRMRQLFEEVGRYANSSLSILLHGETGTGKEVLARAIHDRSPRRDKPLVSVNCGAIPEQLVEEILFGHEKGVFTGAHQQQKGLFEAADGGTIFLDEIGELPLASQAALLRVLDTTAIMRMGATRELKIDVRIIAATHRDLESLTKTREFREDLFFRLEGVTLHLPPLRDRRDEILPLTEHFIRQANVANGRAVDGVEPRALEIMQRYPWPGNVRELRNAIERAVVIAEGSQIAERDLPERVRKGACLPEQASPRETGDPSVAAPTSKDDLKRRVDQYEADLIARALHETGNNQSETARRLGMPRRTLVHKINRFHLRRPDFTPSDP